MDEMAEPECKLGHEVEHQRLREQGDLVIEGFRNLISKYSSPAAWRSDRASIEEVMSNLSIDENGLKEKTLDRLQMTLPILKRHLTRLSTTLDPYNSQQETELKFQSILRIQPKLESTLEHAKCYVALFYPEPTSPPARTNDQRLQRLKSCRLQRLRSTFIEACPRICWSLEAAINLVQQMQKQDSPEEFKRRSEEHRGLTRYVEEATLLIDSTMECIAGSDWDLALKYWQRELGGIEGLLGEIVEKIKPETDSTHPSNKLLREPVVQLAELLIPIIKVSRLFFNKLTIRGVNTKRLPLFTEMSSEQIKYLVQAHNTLSNRLKNIVFHLYEADSDPGTVSHNVFITNAHHIKVRFEAPLLVVLLYLVPAIPDTEGFPTQNYYKRWFNTWNTQRILAIDNFINFARSLGPDPL
ncbi:hypothetical protein Pst134EA_032232 [Puccinia striiformis f. sp. tritici]|uniref:uncharacterized protein n=1 Tax=Puccinia striiformis f. sp. tritici TaxID=168172 RepID=UPI00200831B4|nr:uncharacterized protein Pst134EA_032232 [Puccinia striiformis f. sp. tritici]KAH9444357.1 hypothetical protein Pst134EA_032232 [Puccinia striiformis f. sp. tritici]KAH9460449.1 hypothetical protein Pst134EB_008621 [Puccinia striiformis f. sp. tritici]